MLKLRALALTTLCVTSGSSAHALGVYVGIGFPGVLVGVAQPVNEQFTVRGDIASLGSHSLNGKREGIDYVGQARVQRAGLFADWFVAGAWRLTAGVTSNKARADLQALGNGQSITIGGGTYATTAADRVDVRISFPSTTPYIGFGYGHQASEKGFGFAFDIGASIGRARVSIATQGPNLSQVPQADIDREMAELKDSVNKLRAIPQATAAVNYRF